MKNLLFLVALSTCLVGTAGPVPSLEKDLITDCRVYVSEGFGQVSFNPPQVGDMLEIDLSKSSLERTLPFRKTLPRHGSPYVPLHNELKLSFSEFRGYVSAAHYIDDLKTQQVIVVMKESSDGLFRPEVTIQTLRQVGLEWAAPATLRLHCE